MINNTWFIFKMFENLNFFTLFVINSESNLSSFVFDFKVLLKLTIPTSICLKNLFFITSRAASKSLALL